jgi:hypothetical protein
MIWMKQAQANEFMTPAYGLQGHCFPNQGDQIGVTPNKFLEILPLRLRRHRKKFPL